MMGWEIRPNFSGPDFCLSEMLVSPPAAAAAGAQKDQGDANRPPTVPRLKFQI